jgi:trigger factor
VNIEVTPAAPESGPPQTFELVLGSGQAGPGVEEQLEGASAGEERLVVVEARSAPQVIAPGTSAGAAAGTDPASVPAAEEAPGPRRFNVRVREVKERVLPELDDAFAATVANAVSLAELKERLAANLAEEAESRGERELRDRLLDAIADANDIEVPESMVEAYVERMLHPGPAEGPTGGARRDRHSHGPQESHAHSHQGHEHGHELTHEHGHGQGDDAEHQRLVEILHPAAERGLRRHLILDAVARAENLEPTDAQIDAYLATRLKEGASVPEARRALERKGQLDDLRHHLRTENVFEYLKSQSTIGPARGSAPAEPAG